MCAQSELYAVFLAYPCFTNVHTGETNKIRINTRERKCVFVCACSSAYFTHVHTWIFLCLCLFHKCEPGFTFCGSLSILLFPPPNFPRTLNATWAIPSFEFLKVFHRAWNNSALTGWMWSYRKSGCKLSTQSSKVRSPWLTSVWDPFKADTKGSINIGRYGNKELEQKKNQEFQGE